ncbi:hypothetical protein HRbin02_01016 [Candidatus Calditenuaceae archaeon HR02]|nr:hypothetical protein HRbin02_01016 [Candidatus Calditenuaceae archaeon HR02]
MSYRRGRRFEYEVRDYFGSRGWLVIRAARSKPVDLVCIKGGRVVLVECRYAGGRLTRSERRSLARMARRYRVGVIIAHRRVRGGLELTTVK